MILITYYFFLAFEDPESPIYKTLVSNVEEDLLNTLRASMSNIVRAKVTAWYGGDYVVIDIEIILEQETEPTTDELTSLTTEVVSGIETSQADIIAEGFTVTATAVSCVLRAGVFSCFCNSGYVWNGINLICVLQEKTKAFEVTLNSRLKSSITFEPGNGNILLNII